MQSQDKNWIESILSRMIETTISSQLDDVNHLEIEVSGQPAQLIQGNVQSVTVQGNGIVIREEIRVNSLVIHIKQLAIALLSSVIGKPELVHPASISAQLVLTEADINHLLNSNLLKSWIQTLDISTSGCPIHLQIQTICCQLHEHNSLTAHVHLHVQQPDQDVEREIEATLSFKLNPGSDVISLEKAGFQEGKSLPFQETLAILGKLNELLHVRSLDLTDFALSIQNLTIEQQTLRVWIKANVRTISGLF
jgi:hypothetical protein